MGKKILIATAMILAVAAVCFIFWGPFKEDKDRIRFGTDGVQSDLILMNFISEDYEVYNDTWVQIMGDVNAYRNSKQFANDSMNTRGVEIYKILAEYEGTFIEEGSLGISVRRGCVYGRTVAPYDCSFEIGYHDAEWYRNHN